MKPIKRILSLLLAALLVFGLSPAAFGAAGVPADLNAGDVAVNATNFPDPIFRSYVSSNFDANGNGVLSASEISAATTINLTAVGVSDLKGVEYLTALTTLNCGGNNLTGVDLSQNTRLKTVSLIYNDLKHLDLRNHSELTRLRCYGNPELETLYCSNCALDGLGVTDCPKLNSLVCGGNKLTSLDLSGCGALRYLQCSDNQLESLDLSETPEMWDLVVSQNLLQSLDVSGCPKLASLQCERNRLSYLDLNSNPDLVTLRCGFNQLEGLYVSANPALKLLWASMNQLKNLELSQNTALENLQLGYNQLTSLDLSRNTALKLLTCGNNQLTNLDLHKNSRLEVLWCHTNPMACLNISKTPNIQDAYRYGTVTSEGTDEISYQYGDYNLVVDPELLLITDEQDKGEFLLDLSGEGFLTQKTSEVNRILQETLRYAREHEGVIYLDDQHIDVNDDGIADFVVDQIPNSRLMIYQKTPDTRLEGVFRLNFGDSDFLSMNIDGYSAVYSTLAIKFTELNLGEYVFDMRQGDADYPWKEDEALSDSMEALSGRIDIVLPGFDLNKDGIWDFRVITENGADVLRPNPDSPITGVYSYPQTQEAVEYFEGRGLHYYSPISFLFQAPELEKGEYVFDMTEGPAELPIINFLADEMTRILNGGYNVTPVGEGYDLDGDGIWDIRQFREGLMWYYGANPESAISGSFYYHLSDALIRSLIAEQHPYYDPIVFRFPQKEPENPFEDVPKGKYYHDAVLWAIHHRPPITGGTDSTHFSPNETCTREQIVTFLYAAYGKPGHHQTTCPFKDVAKGKYYYDPVLWAVENFITGGVEPTLFGVGQPCTREQVMTFLWKAEGSPNPKTTNCPFDDVQPGKYYYKAILWAVENGVTGGVEPNLFGVGEPCTRGQVVTFLYKILGPNG